jgi:hypothetical protein
MTVHNSAFDYLKPTEMQMAAMADLRQRHLQYAQAIDAALPDGPDKTYIMRKIREVAMWANVALTRHADGSARG